MLMKIFPHGTGEGDKPSRYLVRPDYPGRDTAPPQVLRGDPAMTRALIDSIERRWKFTSGVLSWHPDEKVSEEQEEEVMGAFERVAFAGLEADQRHILWVRHTHAGHHELHFLIPRLELSSGKDFNACRPGWQKDFDVFRDLFNWREGWARPDDPARARDELPKKADLFKARMERWGKEIRESDRDRAKEVIHAFLREKVARGRVRDREDVLNALKEQGLRINREGRDYISVIAPDSGMKMRFKGGFYARGWTPKTAPEEESGEKKKETARRMVARLQQDFERVIEKRAACNTKRYRAKWKQLPHEEALLLPRLQEDTIHDRNRASKIQYARLVPMWLLALICLLAYGSLMLWAGFRIDTGRDMPLAAVLHMPSGWLISGLCLAGGVLYGATSAKGFAEGEKGWRKNGFAAISLFACGILFFTFII